MNKQELATVDIKGKAYVQVNERIMYFRETYPEWSLTTDIVTLDNGVVVIKAYVHDETNRLRSTGYAYEKEGSTFINKTSYIENCETSAIGRALGNLGIGIETSVASAEEVENAIAQQDALKSAKQNLPDKCKLEVGGNESLARQAIQLTLEQLGYENWKSLDLSRTSEKVFMAIFNEKVNEIEAKQ